VFWIVRVKEKQRDAGDVLTVRTINNRSRRTEGFTK